MFCYVCVPAFYIAGAMTALIPKESITRFLGRNAPKIYLVSCGCIGWLAAGGVFVHHRAAVCRDP